MHFYFKDGTKSDKEVGDIRINGSLVEIKADNARLAGQHGYGSCTLVPNLFKEFLLKYVTDEQTKTEINNISNKEFNFGITNIKGDTVLFLEKCNDVRHFEEKNNETILVPTLEDVKNVLHLAFKETFISSSISLKMSFLDAIKEIPITNFIESKKTNKKIKTKTDEKNKNIYDKADKQLKQRNFYSF